MGLAADIQKKLKDLLEPEEVDEMIKFFKSIGIRIRDYWEAFSGNAVNKLMKEMDKFLAVLPNSGNNIKNMKDILKNLSKVYLTVFVAGTDDQVQLELTLDNLVGAYKNGCLSK
uniref:GLOBIN domain-containing protein n=1 Tax=Rhabditophanes sp. KR3021 TaxID=114890 RepID=A0AC35TQG2_9BILA